ncbi:MAG: hypothetical protein AAFY88_19825, partial [Acidobacteriota bacterium]
MEPEVYDAGRQIPREAPRHTARPDCGERLGYRPVPSFDIHLENDRFNWSQNEIVFQLQSNILCFHLILL